MPDNVSVPSPDFVNEPEPVVIAAIDDVPGLSTVNPMSVPVTPPDNVNDEPESTCTSDADVNSVTTPEIVFVPLMFRIAPLVSTPEPVISIGSATVTPFEIDNAALSATVVLPRVSPFLPSAVLLLIATTPAEIVVLPVYVLALESVSMLADPVVFVNVPEPEITPDNVCADDDAKLNTPDEPIAIAPLYVPPEPNLPVTATEMVPPDALIVVVPL